MLLQNIGWNDFFEANFFTYKEQNLTPARVIRENKTNYLVLSEFGEMTAHLSGKMLYEKDTIIMPVVGDWIAVAPQPENQSAVIHAVLPRKTSIERKVAGEKTQVQVIASNIDNLLLVVGLDDDFNIRRVERYLTMIYDSGASPVILLNKADLCDDVDTRRSEIESIAFGIPIFSISAINKEGLDDLIQYLTVGKTAALIGSSGVGKSTIINHFMQYDKMIVKATSEEKSKGRHTTTHRELMLLPNGALVMDTPGMRELQLWGDEENLAKSFNDIESLAASCRFIDCQHQSEPGCAIKEAIEKGDIDQKRFTSYLKQKRELKHLEIRKTQLGKHEMNKRGRKFAAMIKENYKVKRKLGLKMPKGK